MEEFQIWQLWASNRIGSGLAAIASILAVWLAMRIAAATRNSGETNLFTQIVSSAFGVVTLAITWVEFTTGTNTWIASARSLSELQASGAQISTTAEGYISYVGTTDPAAAPMPLAVAFIVVSGFVILSQIWMPKK